MDPELSRQRAGGRQAAPISRSWHPQAGPRARQLRATLNATIRDFFAQAGVLEVETPLREAVGNPDPQLTPMPVGGASGLLRTSPEFALKRLVAAGSGPVFELGRVFRGGERGRFHHPEFTMLEWYRPGLGFAALIDECVALLRTAGRLAGLSPRTAELSYEALLTAFLGEVPPSGEQALRQLLVSHCGVAEGDAKALNEADCLDLLFVSATEQLPADQITVLRHFPAAQAALATLEPGDPTVARRFEVFWGRLELANGYDELRDAGELAERLKAQSAQRERAGQRQISADPALLAAHASGLPACCGVSVGVDRLLMVLGGYDHIDQVLSFPEVWS
ncbi:MAG: EF-P lysine aminoacylase EpmA [Pseudomonadota bacterium]